MIPDVPNQKLFVKLELEDESYYSKITNSENYEDIRNKFLKNLTSNIEDFYSLSPLSNNTVIDGKRYCCFLCAQPNYGIENLERHFQAHPEKWTKCQLCVRSKIIDCPDFTSLMDFYKHMKICHVVLEVSLI